MGKLETRIFYVPNLNHHNTILIKNHGKKKVFINKVTKTLESLVENNNSCGKRAILIFSYPSKEMFSLKSDEVINFKLDSKLVEAHFPDALFEVMSSELGIDNSKRVFFCDMTLKVKNSNSNLVKVCNLLYTLAIDSSYSSYWDSIDFLRTPEKYEPVLRRFFQDSLSMNRQKLNLELKKVAVLTYYNLVSSYLGIKPISSDSNPKINVRDIQVDEENYLGILSLDRAVKVDVTYKNNPQVQSRVRIVEQNTNSNNKLYLVTNSLT